MTTAKKRRTKTFSKQTNKITNSNRSIQRLVAAATSFLVRHNDPTGRLYRQRRVYLTIPLAAAARGSSRCSLFGFTDIVETFTLVRGRLPREELPGLLEPAATSFHVAVHFHPGLLRWLGVAVFWHFYFFVVASLCWCFACFLFLHTCAASSDLLQGAHTSTFLYRFTIGKLS